MTLEAKQINKSLYMLQCFLVNANFNFFHFVQLNWEDSESTLLKLYYFANGLIYFIASCTLFGNYMKKYLIYGMNDEINNDHFRILAFA